MATKNRKCLACSTLFSFCPDCSKADALKESWHAEFCSNSCKDLWTTLTKFGMGKLTKSEAKEIISALDLKPIETYAACVQRDYAKVMVEEKKPRKIRPVVVEVPTVEQAIIIEQTEPIITEAISEIVAESHEVVTEENE